MVISAASVFLQSSNLVQFVTRYKVISGQHKSTLGSDFHFCDLVSNLTSGPFWMDVLTLII